MQKKKTFAVVEKGQQLESKTIFKSPYYRPSYDYPWNPDKLTRNNLYSIYDEMKDDDQVKAAIAIKKDMVINSGWEIVCEDDEIVKFVTDNLANANQGTRYNHTFEDFLRDVLSAYEYGFSVSECTYKIVNGKWLINTLVTRPPHSFLFDIDNYGQLVNVIQHGTNGDIIISPDDLLIHTNAIEFGGPYGKSDLKAAHESWVAKRFVIKFFNIYLERFASPTVIGKYKKNFTATDISDFNDAVKSIQNNTTLIIPEDTEVTFEQSQKDSGSSYREAIDKYNMQISRAILVPDLLGLSGGETSGGSYSLGKEHVKVFMGVIKKDRKCLESKITQRIVYNLVAYNFGLDKAKDVVFKFKDYDEQKEIENMKSWISAVSSKIYTPNDDEINFFRTSVGFPQGEVIRPQAPAPEPAPAQGPEKEEEKKEDGEEAEEKEVKEEKEAKLSKYSKKELSIYEKKVDFDSAQKTMTDKSRSLENKIIMGGRVIYRDLIKQLKDRGILSRFDPNAYNTIKPKHLKQMNMLIKGVYTDIFMAGYESSEAEIYKQYAKKNKEIEGAALILEDYMELLDADAFKLVGDYSVGMSKEMLNVVQDGVKNSRGEMEIVKLLGKLGEEYSERWAATVARTKTTEIYNNARRSYWENDEIGKEIIVAYQFSAILDDRVSEICEELHGEIFEIGEDIQRVTPPMHFNCRSMLVPITRFEDYKASEIPSVEDVQELGGGLKNFSSMFHVKQEKNFNQKENK